jgi:hypothetical protein
MAKDINAMVRGIVAGIDQYARIATEKKKKEAALMEYEIKLRQNEDSKRRTDEYMSPTQQMLAKRYFRENPASISDVPQSANKPGTLSVAGRPRPISTLESIAQQSKQSLIQESTGGPATTSQGVRAPSTYTPPQPAVNPSVTLGSKGFEPIKSVKGGVQQQILDKIRRGEDLYPEEKKIIGIQEKVTNVKDIKPIDLDRVRKLAKEYAVEETGLDADMDTIPASEIDKRIPRALQFYFPNLKLEEEQNPETVADDVIIKDIQKAGVKKASLIKNMLMQKYKMSDEEATQWLSKQLSGN